MPASRLMHWREWPVLAAVVFAAGIGGALQGPPRRLPRPPWLRVPGTCVGAPSSVAHEHGFEWRDEAKSNVTRSKAGRVKFNGTALADVSALKASASTPSERLEFFFVKNWLWVPRKQPGLLGLEVTASTRQERSAGLIEQAYAGLA